MKPAAFVASALGAAVVLALSLVATLLGAVVYGDAFVGHESPVFTLLFLGIPVTQWGLGVAALVAAVAFRKGRAPAT